MSNDLKWTKKFKGSQERGGAFIHLHPQLDRAVVENCYGFSFDGSRYPSLEQAKAAAEATIAVKVPS